MSSMSRWYCSRSRVERPKSKFVAISYLFVMIPGPDLHELWDWRKTTKGDELSPTLGIIPANYARRNAFDAEFSYMAKYWLASSRCRALCSLWRKTKEEREGEEKERRLMLSCNRESAI